MSVSEQVIDLSDLLQGASLLSLDTTTDFVSACLILDCHDELGEGILYDDENHAVMWTDILGRRFHKLQLDDQDPTKIRLSTYALPKMLCSFGMIQKTTEETGPALPLLCAWEDGFQLYDMVRLQPLSPMSSGPDVNPKKPPTRLNDGRVDPLGQRFICGGYYGDVPGNKMKVYKCEQVDDKRLVHEAIVEEIETTNSISWSLDGETMYLADSPTKQIHAYRYHPQNGTLSDKRLLHEKQHDTKMIPDGSCVDSEGFLWNAVWRFGEAPGMVQRIDPTTGQVVFTVHMPDSTSQVSCCCFGGTNFDILFITTAAESRDAHKEPHAGGLYAVKLPFKGKKESRLNFTC